MTQMSEDYVTSWPIRRRVNPTAVIGSAHDGAAVMSNNYFVIVSESNNGNSVHVSSRCVSSACLMFNDIAINE